MFDFGVGKRIADGALSRIGNRIKTFDINQCAKEIPIVGQLLPMWDDVKSGYNSMTPEQRSEFWKNVMITGAKLGAKMA